MILQAVEYAIAGVLFVALFTGGLVMLGFLWAVVYKLLDRWLP